MALIDRYTLITALMEEPPLCHYPVWYVSLVMKQPIAHLELTGAKTPVEILTKLREQFNRHVDVEKPVYDALTEAIKAMKLVEVLEDDGK